MSAGNEAGDKVFEGAIKNKINVTDKFAVDAGSSELRLLEGAEDAYCNRIRCIMREKSGGAIPSLGSISKTALAKAHDMLASGDVAAIDGTEMLALTNYITTGIFACAAGHVTSRRRGQPQITITQTRVSYRNASIAENADLMAACEAADAERVEQGWTTTFREYCERSEALQCGAPIVLLDGPIFTQNLLTQTDGWALLDQITNRKQRFIGVIKEPALAQALTHFCAFALEPQEYFIIPFPLREQFEQRFRKRAVPSWLKKSNLDEYIRGVYQPNQRAFGFECHKDDIDLALSIFIADASATLHHEIPLLLETIDTHMRAMARPRAMQERLVNTINRPQYAVKLQNERQFR
jgi:hypothetical protein